MFRVGEAAEYLGVNPKSIYRYVWKGYIKPIVLQRTILISNLAPNQAIPAIVQYSPKCHTFYHILAEGVLIKDVYF